MPCPSQCYGRWDTPPSGEVYEEIIAETIWTGSLLRVDRRSIYVTGPELRSSTIRQDFQLFTFQMSTAFQWYQDRT